MSKKIISLYSKPEISLRHPFILKDIGHFDDHYQHRVHNMVIAWANDNQISYDDIARITGKSLSAVKQYFIRGGKWNRFPAEAILKIIAYTESNPHVSKLNFEHLQSGKFESIEISDLKKKVQELTDKLMLAKSVLRPD